MEETNGVGRQPDDAEQAAEGETVDGPPSCCAGGFLFRSFLKSMRWSVEDLEAIESSVHGGSIWFSLP